MRFFVAVLLAALVLAAFLSRSSEKEGFWSKAKGYIAMAGSRFPGNVIGTGFGGTTAAAAACTAQSRCAGFMIKRGKKTKGAERPYWLVDASVLVPSNRQKNGAWTTYITKKDRDALKAFASYGVNNATPYKAPAPASAPAPAPASAPASAPAPAPAAASAPVCNGQVTVWNSIYWDLPRLGLGKGSSKSYPCGDYPNVGPEWNDKIGGIEVPPGLKVDVYEGTHFEKWKGTVRPLEPGGLSALNSKLKGVNQVGKVNVFAFNSVDNMGRKHGSFLSDDGISSFKVAADK